MGLVHVHWVIKWGLMSPGKYVNLLHRMELPYDETIIKSVYGL